MSERNGSTSVDPGTAEIPVVRPSGATVPVSGDPAAMPPVPEPAVGPSGEAAADPDMVPGIHPTAPVTVRPAPRLPRRGPLTVMGPWAPVAGALIGLVLGVVVVLLLAGVADSFEDR